MGDTPRATASASMSAPRAWVAAAADDAAAGADAIDGGVTAPTTASIGVARAGPPDGAGTLEPVAALAEPVASGSGVGDGSGSSVSVEGVRAGTAGSTERNGTAAAPPEGSGSWSARTAEGATGTPAALPPTAVAGSVSVLAEMAGGVAVSSIIGRISRTCTAVSADEAAAAEGAAAFRCFPLPMRRALARVALGAARAREEAEGLPLVVSPLPAAARRPAEEVAPGLAVDGPADNAPPSVAAARAAIAALRISSFVLGAPAPGAMLPGALAGAAVERRRCAPPAP